MIPYFLTPEKELHQAMDMMGGFSPHADLIQQANGLDYIAPHEYQAMNIQPVVQEHHEESVDFQTPQPPDPEAFEPVINQPDPNLYDPMGMNQAFIENEMSQLEFILAKDNLMF